MNWFKRKHVPIVEDTREKITQSFDMSIDFKKIVNERGIIQYQIMGASMPTHDHAPRKYGHYDYVHMFLYNSYYFYLYVPKHGHTYYSIGQIIECYEFDKLCECLHKAQQHMNSFRDYIIRITTISDDIGVRFTVNG